MQPRGPLMIEHRLIERMIALIEKELKRIEDTGKADPFFIDVAVDFIRFYADRTHHGKEEDILFSTLAKKKISDEDNRIMNELIDEHKFSRKITGELVEANDRYRKGDESSIEEIREKLKTLVGLYPKHIEKEDKVFFPEAMKYLSEEEQQAMLEEYWEFDRKMIHEKYTSVVESLEKRK